MPARFVVGQDGTILYAEVNPDYTRRPEPEDMLPAPAPRHQPRRLIEICSTGPAHKERGRKEIP